MYDLSNVSEDFPWTSSTLEPDGFSFLPPGWGDVIHDYLVKLDAELERLGIKDAFFTEQVKEKFGTLRFYYTITTPGRFDSVDKIVSDMEYAVASVCCICGTRDGVKRRGGWIHYSCDACEVKR